MLQAERDRFTQYKWTHLQIKACFYPRSENVGFQSEQRVNIKFRVKMKKSATEKVQLLTEAWGEDCISRARVFE